MNLQIEKYLIVFGVNVAAILLITWGLSFLGLLYVQPTLLAVTLPVGLFLLYLLFLKRLLDSGSALLKTRVSTISLAVFSLCLIALLILEVVTDAHYHIAPLLLQNSLIKTVFAYIAFMAGGVLFSLEFENAREKPQTDWNIPSLYFLIATCVFGFLVKLYLASKMILHIDETYTDLVTLGLFKYHQLGVTVSGANYIRTPIFNFLNSIPYLFITNPLIRLRLFNILLFTAFQPVFYFLVKRLFNQRVAIIFTILTSVSWYIAANTISARSYNILVIFSFLALIYLYFSYNEISINNLGKGLRYFVYAVAFDLVVFFEGHSLGFYHLAPFFGGVAVYFILKSNRLLRIAVIGAGFLCALVITLYFYYLNPTLYAYIVNATYGIQFRSEIILLFGSFFSYYTLIGLVFLSIAAVTCVLSRDRRIIFFTLYCLFVLFFQGYFFGKVSIDIRHFSDILLPVFLGASYVISAFLLHPKLQYIFICVLIVFIGTSINGLNGLAKQKMGWAPYYPDSMEQALNLVPENATVITDYPDFVYFLGRMRRSTH
jgi:hypothetical protein